MQAVKNAQKHCRLLSKISLVMKCKKCQNWYSFVYVNYSLYTNLENEGNKGNENKGDQTNLVGSYIEMPEILEI